MAKLAHTASSEWTYDTNSHWHICTSCKTEKLDCADHIPGPDATEDTPQICTVCNYVITPAIDHTHTLEEIPAKAATCTAEGNNAYYHCTGSCGKYFTDLNGEHETTPQDQIIQKLPHTYTLEVKNADTLKIAGTCKDKAVYYKSCTCGAISSADTFEGELDPANHTGGTELVGKDDADCTTAGYTGDTKCLGCKEIIANGTTIPAKGHTPAVGYLHDDDKHWQLCSVCNNVITETLEAHTTETAWSSDSDSHWHKCTK